ncbi:MAG: isoleucine--tRNA ligase [Phycisphaerales bacterium]|nr:MAG: isoleucine--tRNA ligase [Phycisphaerales bacterium]
MPFDKVDPKVDFPALERKILKFWDRSRAFDTLRRINAGKPTWSFLDGPITANNPMGVHHAWGRTYKDVFQRYFAGLGRDQRYQNGFDCQGLWVEVEVERELGISTKADIERAGLDKFTEACKARVRKYAAVQTEQSKRLGQWMDWDNSYFTMSDENNYTIWSFLKKCHQSGYLYKGTDVMPWSGRAGCAYSHMEIAEGRRLVTHTSVFVRFPIRGRDNEYLLIWTTTPWTLPGNTGAAVGGNLEYVRIRAKRDGAVYYLAKENLNFQRLTKEYKEGFGSSPWPKGVPKLKTIHQIFTEHGGYDVLGTLSGSDMVGWTYDGPFDDLPAQQHKGGFAEPLDIIPAEQRDWPCGRDAHVVFDPGTDPKGEPYVVAGEGTGIVHSAPGCGDVDHVWGEQFKLPAIAPLDDEGRFVEGFGSLTGMRAADESTAEAVIAQLKEKGLLVAAEKYPHVYPHCWRTGDPLVFRLVDEWYISMAWRDQIKKVAQQVTWLPPAMRGLERELDWLTTMRDWMISKKRYWGLALPIWECHHCGHFDVIGSREELCKRVVSGWEQFDGHTPHRPYVDAVKIKCEKCGNNEVSRIPDVGNPWLDAGIVAYSTTHYNANREYWEKWIPADLITECFPGQFRNWFYSILAMSTMMELGKENPRPPFRTLLGHALVLNEERQAMHKSDGTAIWFEEAAEQIGVDVMRWMYCQQIPTIDLPFGMRHPEEKIAIDCGDGQVIDRTVDGEPLCRVTSGPADETRRQVILPLWNIYAFFCNLARVDGFDPHVHVATAEERSLLDRWILSDLHKLIREAHESYSSFNLPRFCQDARKFIENFSTWYVRRSRRRFYGEGWPADKRAAYSTLYEVLTTFNRVIAPIMPFLTEEIYQHLVVRPSLGASGDAVPSGAAGEPRASARADSPALARPATTSEPRASARADSPALARPAVPASVHHVHIPQADDALIDNALSDAVAATIRLVSLGRAARKNSNLKVRQPLAEVVIVPGNDVERQAVVMFEEHFLEELNVKKVSTRDSVDDIMQVSVEPNMKALGAKFGKQTAAARAAIESADGKRLAAALAAGEAYTVADDNLHFEVVQEYVKVRKSWGAAWAGADDGPTTVLADRRVTEALRHEGLARDVIRNVQNLRKDAGLDIADRIKLWLHTDSAELRAAIDANREHIVAETLAVALGDTLPAASAQEVATSTVTIEGSRLEIALARV